jgi:sterol desaturase/sphingolipid hydroxylase (fatty acid hydroxylase superfamily)
VHHSSTELDWLSSVRVHPVNDFAAKLAQVVPLVLIVFCPTVLAAYVAFLTFCAILQHANVNWLIHGCRRPHQGRFVILDYKPSGHWRRNNA